MRASAILSSLGLTLILCASPAAGQDYAPHLSRLSGEPARYLDREMQSRDYVHISTQKYGERSFSYWWSPARRECVSIPVQNGRIDRPTVAPALDCNQNQAEAGRDGDDSDAAIAAAVTIGAAALIGAIASAHKSHHHEDGRHLSDHQAELEYERGHRDGLHHHTYDNRNGSEAYRNGYQSGVNQRGHQTSYRVHNGSWDQGYQRTVHTDRDFDRLAGQQASSVDGTLRDWGFRDVDDFGDNSTGYVIWYNRGTGQCLQMTVDRRGGGVVVDVGDIGFHRACH